MFNFGIQANGVKDIIDPFSPYWQLVRFENGAMRYCEDGQIVRASIAPSVANQRRRIRANQFGVYGYGKG